MALLASCLRTNPIPIFSLLPARQISTTVTLFKVHRRKRNAPPVHVFEQLPEYYKLKKRFRPHPWDVRYPVRAEEVGPNMLWGHQELADMLPPKVHPDTSITHRLTGEEIPIPEMVPELVVPDLTGFNLKPYVSYTIPVTENKPMTPRKLFEAAYAEKVVSDYKNNKLLVENNRVVLEDGRSIAIKKKRSEVQGEAEG